MAIVGRAQNPGQIYKSATNAKYAAVLDPNNDGFVSRTAGGYSTSVIANDRDESAESEVMMFNLYQMAPEPQGDVQIGQQGGATDIIDNPLRPFNSAYYAYVNANGSQQPDGEEILILRMRLAKEATGNLGYSFLIDTDNKFGAGIDPNYTINNPGFEVEVIYGNGTKGVQIFNVDGTMTGTLIHEYVDGENIQKSFVKNSNCATATKPYFLDIAVDFAYIFPYTNNNSVRVAFSTSISKTTALGGNAVDLGGYANTTDDNAAYTSIINSQKSIFDFQNGTALGVLFEMVDARIEEDKAMIRWSTFNELANDHFEIERTVDGLEYEVVATKDAIGTTSNVSAYEMEVPERYTQVAAYYRVVAVDVEGDKTYSSLSFLEAQQQAVKLFPTVSEGIFTLSSELNQTLLVWDAQGNNITEMITIEGNQLNLINQSAGRYTVAVVGVNGVINTFYIVKL